MSFVGYDYMKQRGILLEADGEVPNDVFFDGQ
jgi:hypothetical protein